MDFEFTEEHKQFRQKVREFLEREVNEDLVNEIESGGGWGPRIWEYLGKLGAQGWLAPAIPKEYGGMGANHIQRVILEDEMGYHFAHVLTVGLSFVGPTMLAYGNEEQKKEYIPRLTRGEIEFTLGYTEPQAGSDLAGLEIRAVKDGDDYILNGQKLFNTSMHYGTYVWLAARTNPNVSKHKGISLFIVDSKSPGISYRSFWTMDGEKTNEIFYDNVRVPGKNLVGEENQGWHYINTALAFERNFPIGRSRRLVDELVAYCQQTERNGKPLSKDPLVRQALADLKVRVDVTNMFVYRVAWMADNGMAPEWQAPMTKILSTELMHHIGNTGMQIMGLYGLLSESSKWAPLKGAIEHTYRQAARRSITAGSQEIQRTVIALRGLGLPRN